MSTRHTRSASTVLRRTEWPQPRLAARTGRHRRLGAPPKGAAAQAVEVSAYPDRYAAFEPVAEAILDAMATGTTSGSCGNSSSGRGAPLPAGFAGAFIAAAQTQIGKPYVWGGGALAWANWLLDVGATL